MTATLGGRTENPSSLAGRRHEPLTRKDILRLRELVRCWRCGAVPTETGATHEAKNAKGETVTLPAIVTPHTEGCAGAPRTGRPRKTPKRPQKPAGPCEHCGTEMMASAAHVTKKRFCNSVCRKAAAKGRGVSS
jgi:hypothetical protein